MQPGVGQPCGGLFVWMQQMLWWRLAGEDGECVVLAGYGTDEGWDPFRWWLKWRVLWCVDMDRLVPSSVPRGMQRPLYSSKEQIRRTVLRSRRPSIGRFYKSRCSVLLLPQAWMNGVVVVVNGGQGNDGGLVL